MTTNTTAFAPTHRYTNPVGPDVPVTLVPRSEWWKHRGNDWGDMMNHIFVRTEDGRVVLVGRPFVVPLTSPAPFAVGQRVMVWGVWGGIRCHGSVLMCEGGMVRVRVDQAHRFDAHLLGKDASFPVDAVVDEKWAKTRFDGTLPS